MVSKLYSTKFLSTLNNFLVVKARHSSTFSSATNQVIPEPTADFKNSLSEDNQERLVRILQEFKLAAECEYKYLPQKMSEKNWRDLLRYENTKQRISYFRLIYRNHRLKEAEKRKKELKKELMESMIEDRQKSNPISFPWHHLINDDRYNVRVHAMNAMRSFRLEPPPNIVIDCRFLPLHSFRGMKDTTIQINLLVGCNYLRKNPWPITLVNYDDTHEDLIRFKDTHLHFLKREECKKPHILLPDCTYKNYTDLFPREDIVYLSPDAETELNVIEPEKVYIIGGIVDRVIEKNISRKASLETAQKDGVESKRLPLDTYVKWKSGSKFLTLNSVVEILQDVYDTNGNWPYALEKNIPVRKMRTPEEKNQKVKEFYKERNKCEMDLIREIENRLISIVD